MDGGGGRGRRGALGDGAVVGDGREVGRDGGLDGGRELDARVGVGGMDQERRDEHHHLLRLVVVGVGEGVWVCVGVGVCSVVDVCCCLLLMCALLDGETYRVSDRACV